MTKFQRIEGIHNIYLRQNEWVIVRYKECQRTQGVSTTNLVDEQ